MKPQSLASRERIRERQDAALEAIRLAKEKEGREDCMIQSFGGPVLPEIEIIEKYEQMLEGMIGKQ